MVLPSGHSISAAVDQPGNPAVYARYIRRNYFSVVALDFYATRVLDHEIAADLNRNPRYRVITDVPYGTSGDYTFWARVASPFGGRTRPARRMLTRPGADPPCRAHPPADAPAPGRGGRVSSYAASGRHRRSCLVLPAPPDDTEKSSYAVRSLPYLTTALTISLVFVVLAQVLFEVRNPEIAWPFAFYTLIYFVYQAVSLPINFAGRSFDLDAHVARVQAWRPAAYPSVDIFLPICGEPVEVLRNTWIGVFELVNDYPGAARAFVLDDGPGEEEVREIARSFGFTYVRRPNVGHHKKSGNLAYGLRHTRGEHVVIFDADFRPRPDFLAETLPYMDDLATGLVQTPQYFRVSKDQTWVERAAGATLEVFYRVVQVSGTGSGPRSASGSNAVYDRAALQAAGGFAEIPYAEDSHTVSTCATPAMTWCTCRSCWPPGCAPRRSTRSCASSTAGAAGPRRWSGPGTCGVCR